MEGSIGGSFFKPRAKEVKEEQNLDINLDTTKIFKVFTEGSRAEIYNFLRDVIASAKDNYHNQADSYNYLFELLKYFTLRKEELSLKGTDIDLIIDPTLVLPIEIVLKKLELDTLDIEEFKLMISSLIRKTVGMSFDEKIENVKNNTFPDINIQDLTKANYISKLEEINEAYKGLSSELLAKIREIISTRENGILKNTNLKFLLAYDTAVKEFLNTIVPEKSDGLGNIKIEQIVKKAAFVITNLSLGFNALQEATVTVENKYKELDEFFATVVESKDKTQEEYSKLYNELLNLQKLLEMWKKVPEVSGRIESFNQKYLAIPMSKSDTEGGDTLKTAA